MSFDLERLYQLLPSLYRIRDTELGYKMLSPADQQKLEASLGSMDEQAYGPIKSLLAIIAEQVAVLEENMDQLYDDQFIETCADWAVAYIGDLVGARRMKPIPGKGLSQRAEVANTISYRRRKGTASIIEQLARDVTHWPANVVEYFKLLATTQYMNHLRPQNRSFASLRTWEDLVYNNTPFDRLPHTLDVRRIGSGKYNIQNIGIYLWRIGSYGLSEARAYKVDDQRYTFHPLGMDCQLYNLAQTEKTITYLAQPENVPMPIGRKVLFHELEKYYGPEQGKSIMIFVDGKPLDSFVIGSPPPNLTDILSVCELSDLFDAAGQLIGWANMPSNKIAIDPVLGRIAFPPGQLPQDHVGVSFYYGFSANMGGGTYNRAPSLAYQPEQFLKTVRYGGSSIQDELDSFPQVVPLGLSHWILEIQDNESYEENLTIQVPKGIILEIRAANQQRPLLLGELKVEGAVQSSLILNGLLVTGSGILIPEKTADGEVNQLERLEIKHCTLVPGSIRDHTSVAVASRASVIMESVNTKLSFYRSITGALKVFEGNTVSLRDSIIDATDDTFVAYSGLSEEQAGGILSIECTTVIGKVRSLEMALASDCIFIAGGETSEIWPSPVIAKRLQKGCVRFSYFPLNARLPRPYRCQPAKDSMAIRVRPQFTSLTYGHPAYCQLGRHCATEITQGASDESEMGAFHYLYQNRRLSNLHIRLEEYLRFGLEIGVFFAS